MNIFIDTNIFLSFFHFSSEDLVQLKKLIALIKGGNERLLITKQIIDEFKRNRQKTITDVIKRLNDMRVQVSLPQMAKQYDEFNAIQESQRICNENRSKLIEKLIKDTKEYKLEADSLIQELFSEAEELPISDEIVAKSRLRMELKNPPGKDGSLGDAINWEVLINAINESEDLYFVTDDADFASPLDPSSLDPFLSEEWEKNKKSKVVFYRKLSQFFNEHFSEIELTTEFEKDKLISDLFNSYSFSMTRSIIAKLRKIPDLSTRQLNDISIAAISNNQIYWIATDPVIHAFLESIIKGREKEIDPEILPKILYVINDIKMYGDIPENV